jgi:hypothetical protein
MKVETKDIQGVKDVTATRQAPRGTTSDFKEVLQGAQTKTMPVKTAALSLPPSSPISLISLDATTQVGKASEREIASEIENLLNVMEEYQSKMENPSISLKQIQPLVEKMDAETGKLLPTLDALPDGSGLKDIVNRVLVASSTEVIKFNRGDYL